MNEEDLARTLLDKPADQWPSPYGAVRPTEVPAPAHKVPAELRARIEASIQARAAGGGDELARRRVPRVLWAAAAILPLALAGSWFIVRENSRSNYSLKVAGLNGRVLGFTPSGDMRALDEKVGMREGDAVEIPGRGRLLLNAGHNTMFEITGPARVNLQRARGPAPDIRMNLEYGSLAVFSRGDEKSKRVVWASGAYTYTMTGTAARLTVRGDARRLIVVRGSFKVRSRNHKKAVLVKEGLVLEARGEKMNPPAVLPEKDRAELLAGEKKLPRAEVSEKKKQRTLDPGLDLKTEKAIREHYGSLHRIILTNGTEYRGFPVQEGGRWRIHTIYGIVHADKKFIRSIEVLR